MARRRWQEGTVYLRKSKKLPDAWWGRYMETIETEAGTIRKHRNVRLGDAKQYTKPLARRALREYVDRANNYQPFTVKSQTMGKEATPFSVFAARWQAEVLIHMKASTIGDMTGHINNLFIPAFGKLAVGDIDSERVQSLLNGLKSRLVNGKPISAKTVKNYWTTLRVMWTSAVAWKYADGELRVTLPREKRLRMRCPTIEESKRMLANTTGAEHAFLFMNYEMGPRVGEMTALRVSDVDLEKLTVDFSKAICRGTEDDTKSSAGDRTVCISSLLGATIKEYLAERTEGYLFHTSNGTPWDASNTLGNFNALLKRLDIPKIDLKYLAKIVGKDRTIDQATRREKRAASLDVHRIRHANATAMDSLGLPDQIRKQRIGHGAKNVTQSYTHTFTEDERDAADKLGQFFGTGWPEKEEGKVISFPNLSQKEEGLPASGQEALVNQ